MSSECFLLNFLYKSSYTSKKQDTWNMEFNKICLAMRCLSIEQSHKENLLKHCFSRAGRLTYKHIPREVNEANCVTAVRDVFDNIGIPLLSSTWVGSFPKYLNNKVQFQAIVLPIGKLEPGDILFVKRDQKPRAINHVAVVIDASLNIYHCTENKGAVIEDICDFYQRYSQEIIDPQKLLTFSDDREAQELPSKQAPIIIEN